MHKLKRMLGPLRNNADWAQNHLSVTLSMCRLGALPRSEGALSIYFQCSHTCSRVGSPDESADADCTLQIEVATCT